MTAAADARRVLESGAAIIAPVLAGFTYQPAGEGCGSGGEYAAGRYTRGTQSLEFHVRYSLGMVTYGWGDVVLAHADYLRGLGVTGRYPGYSEDPVDGFRHLAADLAGPLSGFRDGNRREFERARESARQARGPSLP
jgi:hypothetical protein